MSEFRFFSLADFQYISNDSSLFTLPFALSTKSTPAYDNEMSDDLNVPYMVFEILVAIFAIVGNFMVIVVFQRDRKLRRRTNYYIVSLAMADFLVGSLGVPFAILASIGLPKDLYTCLFTVSLLVVLCTISIFCLVAVSVDRYWAILYPMAYSRNVRTRTAIIIISLCWVAGTIVGFLPLFGWHVKPENEADMTCHFVKVMDYNYLVFLYFATIITPALLMLAFYTHIYRVIVKQVRQIVTMNPMSDSSRRNSNTQVQAGRPCHGGTMLRVLGASRKRDVKATQNLSIIVLFFMICWFPLYTINCIKAFCPQCQVPGKLTLFCIILSHLNSAGNPVLYAYHLKDFRLALKNLLLKIMGIEVEQPVDPMHRFSVASQHRLHSIDASMRHSLQPRIYIDSPIWLRQQQQTLKSSQLVPKCGVITPCLNNIHQTVAAVASVPTDIGRDMWNIMEASSGAELEDVNYEFPLDRSSNTPPTPASQQERRGSSLDHCNTPDYSYNNCNYDVSPDESELDEVFLPNIRNSSDSNSVTSVRPNGHIHNTEQREMIAGAMREKLRSDDTDYQSQVLSNQRALTDSSYSDYDVQKQSAGHTPPAKGRLLTTLRQYRLPQQELSSYKAAPAITASNNGEAVEHSGLYSRSGSSQSGLSNSGVYVIENDTSPLSPRRKRKFKKSQRLTKNSNKTAVVVKSTNSHRQTISCTSDSSATTPSTELANGAETSDATQTNIQTNSASASNGNIAQQPALHSEASQLPLNNNNNSNNNNNRNSNNTNHKLNGRATERQQQQPHTIHGHHDMFGPLRAVGHLIFPPLAKHSSLFHLFQPSVSNVSSVADTITTSRKTTASATTAGASTTKTAAAETVMTTTTPTHNTAPSTKAAHSAHEATQPHIASRVASVDESILTTVTDLTEPMPTPQSKAQPPPPTIAARFVG
ncbi:uncharacterized protein LOC105233440 [Bactrocera dorsalis]|uniref:Uncharacterized protein LOC105233440 n=1 Tax=Bactrocera dorsalis TaxID=27457 RepID=A0A6I9VMU4_BACDO|nr:uncharacterized protein LOC105233440 [Bactrocera dorsalis]